MTAGGRPNLIGISGKMGSGKDTLAVVINYVADNFAPEDIARWEQPASEFAYESRKFAQPIKFIIALLIGCDISQLEDREFKEKELGEEWWYYCNSLFFDGETKMVSYLEADDNIKNNTSWYIVKLTPRKLLQLLGTEAGRHIIHPNIWVNALFADYEPDSNWIITDVRFPNEAKAIKEKGGIMIRVNRPQFMANGRVIVKDEHESETALDDYDGFDYVIENDSDSVRDLVDKVKELKIV